MVSRQHALPSWLRRIPFGQRLNAAGYGHLASELFEAIDDELDEQGLHGNERTVAFNQMAWLYVRDLLADVAQLRWSGALAQLRALFAAVDVPTEEPPPVELDDEHPPPLVVQLVANLVVAPLAPPRPRVTLVGT